MSPRLILLLVLVGVQLACTRHEETAEDAGESAAPAPVAVRATAVRRGSIDEVLTARGETQALTVVRVASPVAGRVTFLAVQVGDRLRAGEIVGRVLPLESEAAIHGFSVMRESGALGSEEQARAQQLAAELHARDVPLRAPFAALVASRSKNPGEQVASGDVLVELFDPRSLVVVAQIPTPAALRLVSGAPAEASIGEHSYPGHVAALLPAVMPQSLTVPVRIQLDAAPDLALLGAAVTCRITLSHHADALLVPSSALLEPPFEGRAQVLVASAGKAERRDIGIGLQRDADAEVLDGLREGDLVLSSGQYGLVDGAPIQLEQSPPSASGSADEASGKQ